MNAVALLTALVGVLVLWNLWLRHRVARRPDGLRWVQTDVQLQLWAHAFQHAGIAVVVFDARTHCITAANPTFAHERGYSPAEMVGMPVDALYPPDLTEQARETRRAIDERAHSLVETEQVTRDGRRFPVLVDCSVTHDADGVPQYVVAYVQDLTARKAAEAELRLAAIAFQTQEALMVVDAQQMVQRVNRAFTTLAGYAAGQAMGRSVTTLWAPDADDGLQQRIPDQLDREGCWRGERWLLTAQGKPRAVRVTISAVADATGSTSHFLYTMVDLTGEYESRARIEHMRFFDPLTDLPNRRFLHDRLQQLQDETDARGGVLLLVRLNGLHRINSLMGRGTGDQLLLQVTERLRRLLGGSGELGRVSGRTFALLVRYRVGGLAADPEHVAAYAERVLATLQAPFHTAGGLAVVVTASIGWTAFAPGSAPEGTVLQQAELALLNAKIAGSGQVRQFVPAMRSELLGNDALVSELRNAIAEGTLDLHLQPQVDRGGHVVGAEGLLRWTSQLGDVVPPDLFIPLAEESGLILPLGDWVLLRAASLLADWAGQPSLGDLTLSVNVSARQFGQVGFVDGVRRVLATTGADPARLKLEITESVTLANLDDTASKLAQLRALGVTISIDDFGTGYSSLAYLSRLPLDQLKIDQSFVAKLPDDVDGATIVQSIIGLGHGLGLVVVAEGVETRAQWDLLMQHGCDAFQGYLFGHPMSPQAFEATVGVRSAA